MALRNIRIKGDELLTKPSKPVTEINQKIFSLLDDMAETLAEKNGIGLAAPQIGVLRRVVIIDLSLVNEVAAGDEAVAEENIEADIIELINPEIIEQSGVQKVAEACLSVPNVSGIVIRPEYVKVKALNRHGEEIFIEGTGLLARALCHETDHLDGILFTDKVIEFSHDDEDDYEEDYEQ